MYQSPDFVKAELNVKDDFAAYSSCTPIYVGGYTISEINTCKTVDTGGQLQPGEAEYQCFLSNMSF